MRNTQFISRNVVVIVLLTVLSVSCSKLLDRPMEPEMTEKKVFSNITYTVQYLNDVYSYLPNPLAPVSGTLYESATDDAKYGNTSSGVYRLATGAWNESYNPDDLWSYNYTAIRKCNKFMECVGMLPLTDHGTDVMYNTEKASVLVPRMKGEVYFLRAFFYFDLAKRYGGVPIVLNSLSLDSNLNKPRNTFDQVITQIVSDCDSAFNALPATYLSGSGGGVNMPSYYGRATKWAAQALKAKALAYAASPLFNTSNDLSKWQLAAAALKPFFDGTAPFSVASSYENMFIGATQANVEIIFARVSGNSNWFEYENYPISFSSSGNGVCPSQDFVDAFEMTNGKPITDNTSGYDPNNPYTGRDPRLGKTIIWNNATFNSRVIKTAVDSADGPNKNGGSLTGYYLRKLSNPSLNLTTNQAAQHNAIFFRLADMLLLYAEALNEINASPTADVYTAVNRVRSRTGVAMPGLSGLTQPQMRTRIQNERRVELSFEGQRYWDARRWDIAKTAFNAPLRGMRVTQSGSTFIYTPYVVEQHIFEPKMNLYPIPVSEARANPSLTPTPGW